MNVKWDDESPSADTPPANANVKWDDEKPADLTLTAKKKYSVMGAVNNAISNVPEIAKGLYNIVRHPLDTAQNVADVGMGIVDPYINMVLPKSTDPEQLADEARRAKAAAPLQDFINRNVSDPLGIPGRIADYAYDKPVSAAMNLSGALGVAGKAAEVGGAAKLADVLSTGSTYTNPISGTGALIKSGISKLSDVVSPELLQSGMKIPPSVPKSTRDAAIQTMRDSKILPNANGLAKNRAGIDALNDQITDVINTGAQSGQTVDMGSVVNRIDSLKDFYKDYPRAQKYLDQLDEIKTDVLAQNPADVPLDQAQRMKQRIYQINRKHYGDMKGVEIEADKAIARGLKEEIVTQNPSLAYLNAKESAMINLDEFLERAVNRIGNYNIIRLGDTVLAAGGMAAGGPKGAALAGTLMHLIDGPAFKARLAFALDKAKNIPKPNSNVTNSAFQTQQLTNNNQEALQ